MVKSQKIAKIPEVLVSFLESLNLIPPKQKLLNVFFLLFYAIFFQKKINKTWPPFYHFLLFRKKKDKKRKTKNDFRFIVFPFMNKHKKRKNDEWFPFYRFSFYVRENKIGKTKIGFPFIVSWLLKEQTQKKENLKPTFILTFFVLWTTIHQKR